jgi:hypothetical protein
LQLLLAHRAQLLLLRHARLRLLLLIGAQLLLLRKPSLDLLLASSTRLLLLAQALLHVLLPSGAKLLFLCDPGLGLLRPVGTELLLLLSYSGSSSLLHVPGGFCRVLLGLGWGGLRLLLASHRATRLNLGRRCPLGTFLVGAMVRACTRRRSALSICVSRSGRPLCGFPGGGGAISFTSVLAGRLALVRRDVLVILVFLTTGRAARRRCNCQCSSPRSKKHPRHRSLSFATEKRFLLLKDADDAALAFGRSRLLTWNAALQRILH